MKIGTILLNTSVSDNHPFRYSIYTRQSGDKASFIYPYMGSMNNGHYLTSDIGENKPIKPIGYIDLADTLAQAMANAITITQDAK